MVGIASLQACESRDRTVIAALWQEIEYPGIPVVDNFF